MERAASDGRTCEVRYVYEEQLGKSYALNRGLASSRGDVVLLTDDDILPCEDRLERIIERFRRDDTLQFVYGKVLPRWATQPPPMLIDPRMQVDLGARSDCWTTAIRSSGTSITAGGDGFRLAATLRSVERRR